MIISPGDHILFYGDSITDCGRDSPDLAPLGMGYVQLTAARLLAEFPGWNLQITNRGIGGNRIYDLESRLESDVIELQPTVVSILIGINDTWRNFDSQIASPIPEFQAAYRRVIERIREAATPRIILCEPFLLPEPADRRAWRSDIDQRIAAIRELAWEFQLPYLPLDGLFASASVATGHAYWLPDGVHPSLAGHSLIADAWLDLVTE